MISMLTGAVFLLKPAAPYIVAAATLYLIFYRVVRPRHKALRAFWSISWTVFGAWALWLFLAQMIFSPVNMPRFADSAWLPLLEALFAGGGN